MSSKEPQDETWWAILGILALPFIIIGMPFYWIYKIIVGFQNSEVVLERKARDHTIQLLENAREPDLADFLMPSAGVVPEGLPDEISEAMTDMMLELYEYERFKLPPPPAQANSVAGAKYRDMIANAPDPHTHGATMRDMLDNYLAILPEPGRGFQLPTRLIDTIQAKQILPLVLPAYRNMTFQRLRDQLDRNLHKVSNIPYTMEHKDSAKLITPDKYEGDRPLDYVEGTPLKRLLTVNVPFSIPDNQHTLILGGTGSGKTSLIQKLILHYLEQDVSLVVVDSQTDLIKKLLNLEMRKDPLFLSPHDVPALNLFHVPDRGDPEQTANAIIDVYMFYFDTILGTDLSGKQSIFFKFVARLLLNMQKTMGRSATIMDMFDLMGDVDAYQPAIDALPEIQRKFFANDFRQTGYRQTKEQIRYRLQGILENPTIAKLFTSQENRVDLFEELNNGSVVLIDTAKDYLKSNSAHFGRFFISQILRAIMERAVIPENSRKRTVLIIDEAAEYLNQDMDELLTQVRKYNMTCIFAMQHLDQATPAFRASMLANMNTKYAGGISASDSRILATEMRTTPDYILGLPRLTFAVHSRGMKQPFAAKVTPGALDTAPTRNDYQDLLKRNKERVRARHDQPAIALETSGEPPPGDETVPDTPKAHKPAKRAPKPAYRDPTKPVADW